MIRVKRLIDRFFYIILRITRLLRSRDKNASFSAYFTNQVHLQYIFQSTLSSYKYIFI